LNQKAIVAFLIQFSFLKCRKIKKYVGSQQSISDEEDDNNSDYEIRDDED